MNQTEAVLYVGMFLGLIGIVLGFYIVATIIALSAIVLSVILDIRNDHAEVEVDPDNQI